MKENSNEKQTRPNKSFHKVRTTTKHRGSVTLHKDSDIQKTLNFHNKSSMKSDNKIINFSDMIPKLLEKIKTKNSSIHNMYIDNISNSFQNDSNSSELNDDKESDIENIIINSPGRKSNNYNNSPKKIPKLLIEKNEEEENEYKNLEAPITYRQKRKLDNNSPPMNYRKYSKENKDSLVLKLHKYFFQDGEIENIDTLIKYNLNKVVINNNYNNEENSNQNLINLNNMDSDEFDYYNIKQQVINLMDKFADAFDKENKNQLILAIKDLNSFSDKYKFDYVTQLTLDWLIKLQGKEYDNRELKYIGYYNQIREIMDKMLKELKKKADLIIFAEEQKNKDNKNEIENNNNVNMNIINISNSNTNIKVPNIMINNRNLQKMNSINKEDIFKSTEIVPIKIDIEVHNTLNINEVEEILKNLDEGDLGNLGGKSAINNNKKILNKNMNSRNDNELEAFSYPFKEDDLCSIF